MLVLSRTRNEEIVVGDDIRVIVVDIRGDKVRLGISAPKEVSVHRREVYEAIHREDQKLSEQVPIIPVEGEGESGISEPPTS